MVYLKVSFVLSARIIFRNMFFRHFGETFFSFFDTLYGYRLHNVQPAKWIL